MSQKPGETLSLTSRFRKPALVALALAVLAFTLTACAAFKDGSLSASQPGEIGPVRVHFELCTVRISESGCQPNDEGGQSQYMLGVAVPQGSAAPETITAQPKGEGAAIIYTRNDEVARKISEEESTPEEPWPPAGTEAVGYLSAVFDEEEGQLREWNVDADFGLPSGADGGSFAGPFTSYVASGWRRVDSTYTADRPVDCSESTGEPSNEQVSNCELQEETEVGTSDLKIKAPSASAAPGGQATLQFGLDFASSALSSPNFNLAATSSLPQAGVNLASSSFTPAAPDPETGRSAVSMDNVTVSVPAGAQPGTYDVTLTATTAAGGSVSQVGKLEVTKPQSPPAAVAKLKLGKVKLNLAKGTATLPASVSGPGLLTAAGKGIVKVKRKAGGPKTIKVTIRSTGKAKMKLNATGKAKVKVKLVFKPENGASVTKTKSIVLKKKLT
jgi:hypothetical protein